jgi:ABC-type sulfate transport system permease subunit
VRARLERIRENPRLAVAIAAGAVLVLAWIGWAIYVTTDKGATEGLGVLIAWPALVAAAALIALPFVGAFLIVRKLRPDAEAVGDSGEEPAASRESTDSGEAKATSAG